jgi:hypothetical protein
MKYPTKLISHFHTCLIELKGLALAGKVPCEKVGICCNVSDIYEDSPLLQGHDPTVLYDMVEKFAKGWPHHSGNHMYPIPGSGVHCSTPEMWKGKNLELRLSLIDYLIEKTASNG